MQGGERTPHTQEKGKEVAMHDVQPTTRMDHHHPYPKPMARYTEVLADRWLFMKTLMKMHEEMGTKFMVPIIGGRDLDLHRLFVEVTSRGGIEKLLAEKRWREITAIFNFPSSATNASYILRKHYMYLLYDYEQIYLFGSEGWSSPDHSNTLSLNVAPSDRSDQPITPHPESQIALEEQGRDDGESSTAHTQVDGIIDGEFKHGYLVTVTLGSKKLRGVLYHFPGMTTIRVPQHSINSDAGDHRRVDSGPQGHRSGYSLFFAEQHARLELDHPGKERENTEMIAETEKSVYQERSFQDRDPHDNETATYKSPNDIDLNVAPIQQCPREQQIIPASPKHHILDFDLNEPASSS